MTDGFLLFLSGDFISSQSVYRAVFFFECFIFWFMGLICFEVWCNFSFKLKPALLELNHILCQLELQMSDRCFCLAIPQDENQLLVSICCYLFVNISYQFLSQILYLFNFIYLLTIDMTQIFNVRILSMHQHFQISYKRSHFPKHIRSQSIRLPSQTMRNGEHTSTLGTVRRGRGVQQIEACWKD